MMAEFMAMKARLEKAERKVEEAEKVAAEEQKRRKSLERRMAEQATKEDFERLARDMQKLKGAEDDDDFFSGDSGQTQVQVSRNKISQEERKRAKQIAATNQRMLEEHTDQIYALTDEFFQMKEDGLTMDDLEGILTAEQKEQIARRKQEREDASRQRASKELFKNNRHLSKMKLIWKNY